MWEGIQPVTTRGHDKVPTCRKRQGIKSNTSLAASLQSTSATSLTLREARIPKLLPMVVIIIHFYYTKSIMVINSSFKQKKLKCINRKE